jgi:hypothetical protein
VWLADFGAFLSAKAVAKAPQGKTSVVAASITSLPNLRKSPIRFRHEFAAFLFLLLVDLSNFKHSLPSFLAEQFERIVAEFRSNEVADEQKGIGNQPFQTLLVQTRVEMLHLISRLVDAIESFPTVLMPSVSNLSLICCVDGRAFYRTIGG